MNYTAMEQYWIWLSSVEGIGTKKFYQLLTQFGDARTLWDALADGMPPELSFLDRLAAQNLWSARDEGYGAIIALAWALMSFSVQPLYVFTEWVPDNIVEWSSLMKVFTNLTAAAARPVRVGSRELRVVEFWGGVVRWGTIFALLGMAMRRRKREE